jgi:Uma2 family endonuclease
MSTTALPKARMSVAEFPAWSEQQPDDRYELVDGEVVAMTRETVRHNRTKFAAARALDDAVRPAGLPCRAFVDGVGVSINDRTLRIPDVVVQCGPEPDPDALVLESPLIVVEVVSRGSEGDDTEAKLVDHFAVPGIRHHLIVFSRKRVVVQHQRDGRGMIETRIAQEGELTLNPPRDQGPRRCAVASNSLGCRGSTCLGMT